MKPIMAKEFFLRLPSEPADATNAHDAAIAQDLVDTLRAHRATCVGMAANMIGERKRIIAVVDENDAILVMFNPQIVQKIGPYETQEGCLSLPGMRSTTRFKRITVSYQDAQMRSLERKFDGRVAQAIQHEIDHCNGVII